MCVFYNKGEFNLTAVSEHKLMSLESGAPVDLAFEAAPEVTPPVLVNPFEPMHDVVVGIPENHNFDLELDLELEPKAKSTARSLIRFVTKRRSRPNAEEFLSEWDSLVNIQEDHPVLVYVDDKGHEGIAKAEAVRLHTEAYLRDKIIDTDSLNSAGQFKDEYTDRSKYFYVENGASDASARHITTDEQEGIFSLPTFKNFVCDPLEIAKIAKVDSLSDLKQSEIVEISGLSTRRKEGSERRGEYDALLSLYSTMFRDSLESGVKLWVQNVEPRLLRLLKGMAGKDQIAVLGDPRPYIGNPTMPIALNPAEIVKAKLAPKNEDLSVREIEYRKHLVHLLQGINGDKLTPEMRSIFDEAGIEYTRSSVASRLARNPQTWLQLGVGAYSLARAIPASFVDEFEGSIGMFMATDLLTSPTYTWGAYKMFSGKKLREKAVGAAVAVPSFIAPYAYWYSQGEDYPGYVNVAAAGFVTSALGMEVGKKILKKRSEDKLLGKFKAVELELIQE